MTEALRVEKTIKLFIGGEFVRTESGRSFPAHYRKGRGVYAQLCRASRKDFRNAVTSAQSGFGQWSSKSAYNRGQILYRMAEMMESRKSEILEILEKVTEGPGAHRELEEALASLVYYAGFTDKYQQVLGAVNPVSGPHHNFSTCEPVGVVALWAHEEVRFSQVVEAVAAALCAGVSLVAAWSGEKSAVLAALAEVFATSDVPPGVVNLLSVQGDEIASQLGAHMEVQALGFWDETKDKEFQTLAAENLKRLVRINWSVRSLEAVLSFLEFKTVWHPIGR